MDTYCIVKWWPDRPETKERATERVFTDLAIAEIVKTGMENCIPQRCFAIEIKEELPTDGELLPIAEK